MPTATGLDFEPLDDGTILIERRRSSHWKCSTTFVALVALSKGSPLAREIAKKLSERNAS